MSCVGIDRNDTEERHPKNDTQGWLAYTNGVIFAADRNPRLK
jgi:hypothetical protein